MNGFEALFSLVRDFYRLLTGAVGYGIVCWFLATIFAWSGVVKLRRPTLTAMAMVDFGVFRRVQPVLGWMLGAVELTLAFALATQRFPQLTLLLTAMLLWVFTIFIARSLWRGKAFACFCFGDTDSEMSPWTLLRTVALALLATVMALTPIPADLPLNYQANVLQVIIAWSFVGTVVLGSYMLRLLRWGDNPFDRNRTHSVMEES